MAEEKSTARSRQAATAKRRADRRAQVWDLFMSGNAIDAIARIVDCAWATALKDIRETEQALDALDALRAEDVRKRAIRQRQHLKATALAASAEAEPKDRGSLIKVATENQSGIEDLEGLRPKEPAAPQASVYLFPLGDGSSPKAAELSREERAAAKLQIDAELEALPAPADAEAPAAEYTPVEEPAETPDESPPESAS